LIGRISNIRLGSGDATIRRRLSPSFLIVVEFQNFHASLLHRKDETVAIFLSFLHPNDLIEQQIAAVARCKSLMRQPWPANYDGPEVAYFRVNAKLPIHITLAFQKQILHEVRADASES
jgi:hypothetical protein